MKFDLLAVGLVALVPELAACASTPTPSSVPSTMAPSAELAVRWNRLLLSVAEEEDAFLTLKGVRAAAMMHAAMHDALNSVEPRYATYVLRAEQPLADPRVAAATAAFLVAADQYPDRKDEFQAELARTGSVAVGARVDAARKLGADAAAAVLQGRRDDGWDGEAEYAWHPMGPGVYAEFREHSGTPEGFVFGAGWAKAKPFLLDRPDQFRSPPPPDIASDDYTHAFREVKEVGRKASESRSTDQTHLALWWKDFVESSHNRLGRKLAVEDDLDLWRATRLFTLLNMSIYDAYVNVFDNKFAYNHWRPYTAIRWAEHDGNPDTVPDAEWTNTHGHTYPFPSYPSAHGCASAAAMETLRDTFGADRSFTMDTRWVDRAGPLSGKMEMDPPQRSFKSFREAARECSLSRVYLGIHFRYDSVEGNALGRRIGRFAVENHLVPGSE